MTEVTPPCDIAHNREAEGSEQHRNPANLGNFRGHRMEVHTTASSPGPWHANPGQRAQWQNL